MDGIGADSQSQVDDLLLVEETLYRAGPDQVGLVGFFT